mgnify:CR=1 FL=1
MKHLSLLANIFFCFIATSLGSEHQSIYETALLKRAVEGASKACPGLPQLKLYKEIRQTIPNYKRYWGQDLDINPEYVNCIAKNICITSVSVNDGRRVSAHYTKAKEICTVLNFDGGMVQNSIAELPTEAFEETEEVSEKDVPLNPDQKYITFPMNSLMFIGIGYLLGIASTVLYNNFFFTNSPVAAGGGRVVRRRPEL